MLCGTGTGTGAGFKPMTLCVSINGPSLPDHPGNTLSGREDIWLFMLWDIITSASFTLAGSGGGEGGATEIVSQPKGPCGHFVPD